MGKNKEINYMEHNTFSPGVVVGILLAFAIGGLALYYIKREKLKRTKKTSKGEKSEIVNTDNNSDKELVSDITDDKITNQIDELSNLKNLESENESKYQKNTSCEIKVSTIKPFIKKFATSIGALWPILSDGNEDGLGKLAFDNLDLIIQSIDSSELKDEWKVFSEDRLNWDNTLYKDKASSLIDLLKNGGVEIFFENKIVWNNNSHLHYRKFSKVEIGDECQVLSPYAIYQGAIIEQGLVK